MNKKSPNGRLKHIKLNNMKVNYAPLSHLQIIFSLCFDAIMLKINILCMSNMAHNRIFTYTHHNVHNIMPFVIHLLYAPYKILMNFIVNVIKHYVVLDDNPLKLQSLSKQPINFKEN